MKLSALIRTIRGDQGSSLLEMALIMPTLALFLVASFDFGRAYFLANEVAGAAHAGAVYGSQKPSDTAGVQAAATSDAPDVSNLSVSNVSYGCECSDGTSSSVNCSVTPTCSYNVVYWVKVTATANYRPVFPWPGIPASISLSSTATMRKASL